MSRYLCRVCEYVYDEERKGTTWDALADDWLCPVCESVKSLYDPMTDDALGATARGAGDGPAPDPLDDRRRVFQRRSKARLSSGSPRGAPALGWSGSGPRPRHLDV